MIDLYYWTTPNGYKILMALEELGLQYRKHAVDIGKGEQFAPEFLAISPNNKIPAIVDHDQSLSVFESGAILLHLAEKTGRLLPEDPLDRSTALQWLFWQMGGLGPMLGQYFHFANSAENIPYAIDRYQNESLRLLGVLETQLTNRAFLAGEYSIADIASYPWVLASAGLNIDLAEFPNTNRWLKSIRGRPTTVAAYGITTTHADTDSQAA